MSQSFWDGEELNRLLGEDVDLALTSHTLGKVHATRSDRTIVMNSS